MTTTQDNTSNVSELELLKQQADLMGIEYANNVNNRTLKKRIQEHLNQDDEEDNNAQLMELEKDNLKLLKILVTPMEAHKKDYQGEIFSCGNAVLGTVTKFVPFNVEWLVPNILVKQIKQKEAQIFTSKRNEKGQDIVQAKMIKAYAVQELPLPTKEELEQLAKLQQARNSLDD